MQSTFHRGEPNFKASLHHWLGSDSDCVSGGKSTFLLTRLWRVNAAKKFFSITELGFEQKTYSALKKRENKMDSSSFFFSSSFTSLQTGLPWQPSWVQWHLAHPLFSFQITLLCFPPPSWLRILVYIRTQLSNIVGHDRLHLTCFSKCNKS